MIYLIPRTFIFLLEIGKGYLCASQFEASTSRNPPGIWIFGFCSNSPLPGQKSYPKACVGLWFSTNLPQVHNLFLWIHQSLSPPSPPSPPWFINPRGISATRNMTLRPWRVGEGGWCWSFDLTGTLSGHIFVTWTSECVIHVNYNRNN